MQPIETIYKGHRFRSRLEARWAIFFDVIGLKWEYEVEGFELSNGERYLPDFKIKSPSGFVSWYDVKPSANGPSEKLEQMEKDFNDKTKFEYASQSTYASFRTLEGDPYECLIEAKEKNVAQYPGNTHMDKLTLCPRCGNIGYHSVFEHLGEVFFNCFPCDIDTPGGGGNATEQGIIAEVKPHKGLLQLDESEYQRYLSKIRSAAEAARSARFEFGETPRY